MQHDPGDHLERDLLAAAQAGDEHAFRRLVELHRAGLQAHCYRMLASLQDAEDAYQDTLLRAWRALDGFDGRSRLITWLHRIATNVCLVALQRNARQRVLPADLDSGLVDPDRTHGAPEWIGPYAGEAADPSARMDARESIELAFVAALQLLPARQRAALILSEVLGYRAAEIAAVLDTTVPAINSALQRARARLDTVRPAESQQSIIAALGEARVAELVARFATALEEGDTGTLTRLLTDDVVFEMPPFHDWARGRDDVAASWLVPARRPTHLRTLVTRINGQPAVAVYRSGDAAAPALPLALDVLGLDRRGVARITAFRAPESFGALGLPDALPRPECGS